jgi:hypothetical protein
VRLSLPSLLLPLLLMLMLMLLMLLMLLATGYGLVLRQCTATVPVVMTSAHAVEVCQQTMLLLLLLQVVGALVEVALAAQEVGRYSSSSSSSSSAQHCFEHIQPSAPTPNAYQLHSCGREPSTPHFLRKLQLAGNTC